MAFNNFSSWSPPLNVDQIRQMVQHVEDASDLYMLTVIIMHAGILVSRVQPLQ